MRKGTSAYKRFHIFRRRMPRVRGRPLRDDGVPDPSGRPLRQCGMSVRVLLRG